MSQSTHTPGPWELVSLSGYGSPFSVRMAYMSAAINASKTHYGVQSIRRREDALLIAAAPDILAALHSACSSNPDWELITSAIAKAEGRALPLHEGSGE